MRPRTLLCFVAIIAMAFATLTPAGATTEYTQRTERLTVSAGCPQDTPGTCTSTRWLGKSAGDSSSNFITAITPVDEVLYRAGGTINWRDYPADSSVKAEGYRLIGGSTITAKVTFTAQGAGVNNTVHGRLALTPPGSFGVTLDAPDQTILTMAGGNTEVTLTFTVPASMDGQLVKVNSFSVAIHGVNAAAGYINQQGGSTVSIPHLVEVS